MRCSVRMGQNFGVPTSGRVIECYVYVLTLADAIGLIHYLINE